MTNIAVLDKKPVAYIAISHNQFLQRGDNAHIVPLYELTLEHLVEQVEVWCYSKVDETFQFNGFGETNKERYLTIRGATTNGAMNIVQLDTVNKHLGELRVNGKTQVFNPLLNARLPEAFIEIGTALVDDTLVSFTGFRVHVEAVPVEWSSGA